MLEAGIEKELRDTILGHSLKGMDVYYLSISEQSLKDAMDKYTKWLDQKVAEVFGSVDQSVDQTKKGTKSKRPKSLFLMVPRPRVELGTRGFSVPCSTG